MSNSVIETSAGDRDVTVANPLDQGQRMQQREEWERAFLDAQRRQPGGTRMSDSPHGADAETTATAEGIAIAAEPAFMIARESSPDARGSERGALVKTGDAVSTAPRAVGAVATDPAAPVRETPLLRQAARASGPVRSAAVSPAMTSRPAGDAEPVVVQAHEKDGLVHVLMRDTSLTANETRGLVARLRGLLQRLGLRLAALTLNGQRVVDVPARQLSEAPERPSGRRDLDLSL